VTRPFQGPRDFGPENISGLAEPHRAPRFPGEDLDALRHKFFLDRTEGITRFDQIQIYQGDRFTGPDQFQSPVDGDLALATGIFANVGFDNADDPHLKGMILTSKYLKICGQVTGIHEIPARIIKQMEVDGWWVYL
jgi:hypothetical protein